MVAAGKRGKDDIKQIHLPCWMTQREERLREKEVGYIISLLIEAVGDNFNDKKGLFKFFFLI